MKFFKEALLLVLLFVFTTIVYQHVSYPKKLRIALQREIALNLGVQSTIGRVKINFLRGEVKIKKAYLKNPYEDFQSPFLVEFPGIYARFSPLAFFRRDIILDEVVIFSPRVYLEYNNKERSNFELVRKHAKHYKIPRPKKYFTIRDLEIRDLEVLQIKDSTKAHNIEEIIVKNIGAQEAGIDCSKLSCQFLDIISHKALKQYLVSDSLLKHKGIEAQNTIISKDSKEPPQQDKSYSCESEDNFDSAPLDDELGAQKVTTREVDTIMKEREDEIKELKGALGVEMNSTKFVEEDIIEHDDETKSARRNVRRKLAKSNNSAPKQNNAEFVTKYEDFFSSNSDTQLEQ